MGAINELTMYDLVKLSASFISQTKDNFDCSKCLAKNNKQIRINKSCFEPVNPLSAVSVRQRGYNIKFKRCVGNFRSVQWEEAYRMYEHWAETKLNPFGGAYSEMTCKTMDVFYMIDTLMNQRKKEMDGRRSRNR